MVTKPDRRAPLDPEALHDLALSYVARYATSAAKCRQYLARKLRERGWFDDSEPPIGAVVSRLQQLGYIDDAEFARVRAAGLLRRGYGIRRVDNSLHGAGIDAATRDAVRPGRDAERQAALALARKRGFGPFGREIPDRARREKQIAAMLRAGHPLDSARRLIDAGSIEQAELWAKEG